VEDFELYKPYKNARSPQRLGQRFGGESVSGGFRMWRPTDNLLRNVPPQSSVRGISMVHQRYESFQSPSEFSNRIVDMSGLQLLRAPADCLESLFKVMRGPELLWLRCEIYSLSSLPVDSNK